MLAVISAPNRSAHQRASGSGSVLSNVMEAMRTVMAAHCQLRAAEPMQDHIDSLREIATTALRSCRRR